jgi:repressor LexA
MLPLTKRQREILDYLNEFIAQHGYAPSLEEIGRRFGLTSLATVHKHLTNLQEKGFIKRAWNRSRSVEMVSTRPAAALLSFHCSATSRPAAHRRSPRTRPRCSGFRRQARHAVPRVRGDSMIDEHIRDGDFVVDRKTADNGEMVIALQSDVTLKSSTATPAENPPAACQRCNAADFRRSRSGPGSGVVVGAMRSLLTCLSPRHGREPRRGREWRSRWPTPACGVWHRRTIDAARFQLL